MLTSNYLIEKTGISRITLNNYVKLGIVPKPVMSNSGALGAESSQMATFPDETLDRIETISQFKQEGYSLDEICEHLLNEVAVTASVADGSQTEDSARSRPTGSHSVVLQTNDLNETDLDGPRVTIEDLPHPAYMINHNFELMWVNPQARHRLFAGAELPSSSESRNLLRLLPSDSDDWNSLLRFHIALAKGRLSADNFSSACRGLDPVVFAKMQEIYADVIAEAVTPVLAAPVSLLDDTRTPTQHTAYASYFREGMLIVLQPEADVSDAIVAVLSRRDELIRSLLRRKLPVLTDLAVMVADLQGSVTICSELPPEEYFELINEIWSTMVPIYRTFHATCGKHVGDGMVYYFFPQPDSNYMTNALACAQEVRAAMQKLSKAWQIRKNWFNELYLNTGITEGQEWLGTYQSSTGVEFVVLGDTINQAARVSDVARNGTIWASKNLIGKMPTKDRDRINFGVRRRSPDGREHFVASSFSLVSSLLEQDGMRMEKMKDIATLAITEIIGVNPAQK